MQTRWRAGLPIIYAVLVLSALQGTGLAVESIVAQEPWAAQIEPAENLTGRSAISIDALQYPQRPPVMSYRSAVGALIEPGTTTHDRRTRRATLTNYKPRGPRSSFAPEPGQAVFQLHIPRIGLDETVFYGTDQAQLARGPGHYPSCNSEFDPPYCAPFKEVWPGEIGRTIIGGHRTMAGAEFIDLGLLRVGDGLRIDAQWGSFLYKITRTDIVDPLDRSIVMQRSSHRELVLVTCHPKYSAAQRLLQFARLVRALPPERRSGVARWRSK